MTGEYGPAIRRHAIHDGLGRLLRCVDVHLEDGVDPRAPNRTVRRARRTDPLETLYRAGGLSGRGLDAGSMLRGFLEQVEPSVSGCARSEIHVAAFLRVSVSDGQLAAARKARQAFLCLQPPQRVAVAWVCCGGTVDGLRDRLRIRRATAAMRVRDGMEQLADFFFGAGT